MNKNETIVIIDNGSQTTHLIGRRLRDMGAKVIIVNPQEAIETVKNENPRGIILSGGPSSVYEKGAPTINPEIFATGIPLLGICYGLQLAAHLLGGKVVAGRKEYGPAKVTVDKSKTNIVKNIRKVSTVWMSHGDEVIKLPKGFETIGSTPNMKFAIVVDKKRQIYGLQFHPEVEHTECGTQFLKNFLSICGILEGKKIIDIEAIIKDIKEKVGDAYVIGAVSGGVDSTVAGVLTAEAIDKQFIPIYVENGLMREGTATHVKKIFQKHNVSPIIVDVEKEMLEKLKGVTDPEEKRKIVGNFYIEVFEREMKRLSTAHKNISFLMQGTIYSDVIESKGSKHADKIKSHHNVGGLPENMKLKLLEPLREFYKDEVRIIGERLKLPKEFVWKQKFPGPGHAIRIRGEVTTERLHQVRIADQIVLEEIENAGWMDKVFHSFPVMTGALSTAVKGDGRFFGEVIALRVTISSDEMTSGWAPLPYDLLQRMSSRIVNEVPGISRVVYDITTKPPATMEWE